MFNPNKSSGEKAQKAAKKKALADIRGWSLSMIPMDLQTGLILDINEVVCGDPTCAPIDTVFTLIWEGTGKGVFAIPLTAAEITQDDLLDFFPDHETLGLWKAGKKARWPKPPVNRFAVGDRVECRVGPHPVKGWAPGRIIRLNYTEPNWPPNMIAPYQIALHDGRLIFAPQDTDQVIRLRPPAAPDAPSSPEYVPNDDEDEDYEGEDDDEDGEGHEYEEMSGDEEEGEAGEGMEGAEGEEGAAAAADSGNAHGKA